MASVSSTTPKFAGEAVQAHQPDPKIYHYQGDKFKLKALHDKGRSPIETQIAANLQAIDLSEGESPQLIHDLSTYGFAVLETNDEQKSIIAEAFQKMKTFFSENYFDNKKKLKSNQRDIHGVYFRTDKTQNAPGTDQKHIRFLEELQGDREFYLQQGGSLDKAWQAAQCGNEATELRDSCRKMIDLLETSSQKVLEHIAKLFNLKPDFFNETGHETDNSQLRLIHCMSADEFFGAPAVYGSETKLSKEQIESIGKSCIQIHTDWGLITTLPAATAKGLEFWYDDAENKGENSGWVKLPADEGQLIVMPGNVMDIITAGKLRSVPHRVITDDERYSVAYFTEAAKATDLADLKQKIAAADNEVDASKTSFFETDARSQLKPDTTLDAERYMFFMENGKTPGNKVKERTRKRSEELGVVLAKAS